MVSALYVFGYAAVFIVPVLSCLTKEYKTNDGWCCPKCKEGSVVQKDCTAYSGTQCRSCDPGTYMNQPNSLYNCFNCTSCDTGHGLFVKQNCTATTDTVCDVCEQFASEVTCDEPKQFTNMGDLDVDLHGIFEENVTSTDDDYDYQYPGDESFVKRGSEAVWVPALYSIVFFVGILGNIILLTVLAQKRRLWSISDTFILHLSIADILLLLMLPFWAAQTSQPCDWSFGIFSQIFGVIFKLNYYCGIFLLFCISLQNYLSVIHGIQLYSHEKPFFVHISCLSVWLISVVLTIPDWIFPGVKKDSTEEKTCVHIYPQSGTDWQLWSRLLHHIFGLVLPAFMLIILSYMLWRRCSSNAARMQRNITVILSLVGVFCLCWMPYNFKLVLDTVRNRLQKHPNDSHESSEGSLKTLLVVASALGCLHASLRPLLYLGLCGNFRQHLLAMLRCNKTEPKASLWDLGVDQRQQPDHSQVQQEELEQMTVVESQLAQ